MRRAKNDTALDLLILDSIGLGGHGCQALLWVHLLAEEHFSCCCVIEASGP